MFEWHFTIRGPVGTDFEGGIYHGRILLPSEYPFKPPNIVFLTKNGRFETGTKICLSISAYHPEHWQPAWGVRTMLEAIISFLPTEGQGAIGALDWTPRERKKLAKESVSFKCPICGEVRDLLSESDEREGDAATDPEIAAQLTQLHLHGIASDDSARDRNVKEHVIEEPVVEKGVASALEPDVSPASEENLGTTSPRNGFTASTSTNVAASQPVMEPVINRAREDGNNIQNAPPIVNNGADDFVDKVLLFILALLGIFICVIVAMKTSQMFVSHSESSREL